MPLLSSCVMQIVRRLEEHGVRAVNPAGGFPMEMARYPARIWIVSHKEVAVEAGLGVGCLSRICLQEAFARGSLIPLPVPGRDFNRQLSIILHG